MDQSVVFVYPMPLQTLHEALVMNGTTEVNQMKQYQTPIKALLSTLPGVLFLYVNGVMMFTLLRKPLLLESSRYILFGHLLLTDSLQLLVTMLLYIFAVTMVRMISYVCMVITMLAAIAVKISPLNLAVMCLERYVSICFPLRHADIATTRTTGKAIAFMWTVASLESFTQVLLFFSLENTGFTLKGFCTRENVFRLQIYSTLNKAFIIMLFVLVSMIIMYTYIAIMFTVKSVSSNISKANKAHKTVLLHLFQLCLCLMSTLFNMINSNSLWQINPAMAINFQYILFVGLIIFPKCLSPLIYGLRDHTFRHVFKYYFTFGFKTPVGPRTKT
ncbi:odorant receptor 131-2-like [Xiphias gladius]|uniref:odorant receptor 131-2-like n=1 Tax=Xiphias gladius TaxID=8245 RepID=UPI001A993457|nr:odorant receptor 131-2-like [Xiphias gladius]